MTKIMISGIRSSEQAMWVLNEKPAYVGLVLFSEEDKDYVKMEQAYGILRVLQAAGKEKAPGTVAVTQNPSTEQIGMIQKFGFDYVQVQGKMEKSVYDIIQLPIIRVVDREHMNALDSYLENEDVVSILFDISGWTKEKQIDWMALGTYVTQIKKSGKECILTGDMEAFGLKEAVENLRPDALDINVGADVEKEAVHACIHALGQAKLDL